MESWVPCSFPGEQHSGMPLRVNLRFEKLSGGWRVDVGRQDEITRCGESRLLTAPAAKDTGGTISAKSSSMVE